MSDWHAELYEYCIKEGLADAGLIAKWKKVCVACMHFGHTLTCVLVQQGYENLCCLRCISTQDTAHGTNCICRVPKRKLEEVCPA